MSKSYEVWREVYWTHEEWDDVELLGVVEAESFEEACKKHFEENPHDMFDEKTLTYWGCKLFDNKKDARKSWEETRNKYGG